MEGVGGAPLQRARKAQKRREDGEYLNDAEAYRAYGFECRLLSTSVRPGSKLVRGAGATKRARLVT